MKLLQRKQPVKVNTSSSPVDVVSMVTYASSLSLLSRVQVSYSRTRSLVVLFRENTFLQLKKGLEEALENGCLAGYPVEDLKATLYDGSYHDVDSNEMAFKIAASMAFKEVSKKAGPVILEPIMKVEVVAPEEYTGDVMGDLSSRRGKVEGMDMRGGAQVIKCMVPLKEMFGYATQLRSITQGRATYTMHFDHYEQVPNSIAEEIMKTN